MLAAIENRMEELFETMENLPAEKIEAAEKVPEGRGGGGDNGDLTKWAKSKWRPLK